MCMKTASVCFPLWRICYCLNMYANDSKIDLAGTQIKLLNSELFPMVNVGKVLTHY